MNRLVIKYSHIELLFLVVSFLFAISVFNLAGYIFPVMLAVILFCHWKHIKISVMEIILACFSVSYFAFYTFHYEVGIKDIVIYLIGPVGAYLMSKLFVQYSKRENAMMILILVLSAGMFAHGALNFLTYIRSGYATKYSYLRLAMDVWRNEIVSVTCTGMYYTFATGLSIGVLTTDFSKKYKRIAAVILALCISMTVYFANRTLLVIVAILFVLRYTEFVLSKDMSKKKKTGNLIRLCFVIALIAVALSRNLFGIADKLTGLKIIGRFDDSLFTEGRFGIWLSFFKDINFLKFPFGGDNLSGYLNVAFLHNLWLDIYDDVGCIPFIFFCIFTIKSLQKFYEYRKHLKASEKNKELICYENMMMATVLNCMVEPIIEANPYFFLITIMFIGSMVGQINKETSENNIY